MEEEDETSRSRGPVIGSHPLLAAALWIGLITLCFWILRVGRTFLIPLVLAVFAFYLIEILNRYWRRIRVGGRHLPRWIATPLSATVIIGAMIFVSNLIVRNASAIQSKRGAYQESLNGWYQTLREKLPERVLDPVIDGIQNLDLARIVSTTATSMLEILGNGSLVLMYLFFMLLERPFLGRKLKALVPDSGRRSTVRKVIQEIDEDVRTYIGVKTFVSILTAALAYLVMRFVGLDFAEFWALLVFAFNFIPNIGFVISSSLPTILAILQFDSARPVVIVAVGVAGINLLIANFLEPQLMGKNLNLSPLVVVLSLVFWGSLWGLTGMFLCVPIAVVASIILSYFPNTRWVSVLLSRDGDLDTAEDT